MAKRRKRKPAVDEGWLQSVAEELRDLGCDEMFIQFTLDDLREGEAVSVSVAGQLKHYGYEDEE